MIYFLMALTTVGFGLPIVALAHQIKILKQRAEWDREAIKDLEDDVSRVCRAAGLDYLQ